jgi:transposase
LRIRDRIVRDLTRNKNRIKGLLYFYGIEYPERVPGIGPLTAMKLLTELESVDRFNSLDQLCSYVGLVPSTHSCGENRTDNGITTRRNSSLRGALIESAWIAIRNDPALLPFYQKHCKVMNGFNIKGVDRYLGSCSFGNFNLVCGGPFFQIDH